MLRPIYLSKAKQSPHRLSRVCARMCVCAYYSFCFYLRGLCASQTDFTSSATKSHSIISSFFLYYILPILTCNHSFRPTTALHRNTPTLKRTLVAICLLQAPHSLVLPNPRHSSSRTVFKRKLRNTRRTNGDT